MISVLLDHVLDLENLVQDLPSPVLHPDPYQGQDPDRNQNLCPDLDLDPNPSPDLDQALAQVLDQRNPNLCRIFKKAIYVCLNKYRMRIINYIYY